MSKSVDRILTVVLALAQRGGVATGQDLDEVFGFRAAKRSAAVSLSRKAGFTAKLGHLLSLTEVGVDVAQDEGSEVTWDGVQRRLEEIADAKRAAADDANDAKLAALRAATVERKAARPPKAKKKWGPKAREATPIWLSEEETDEIDMESRRTGLSRSELVRRAWMIAEATLKGWPTLPSARVRRDPADEYTPSYKLNLTRRTGLSHSVSGPKGLDALLEQYTLSPEDIAQHHIDQRTNVVYQRSIWLGRLLQDTGPQLFTELEARLPTVLKVTLREWLRSAIKIGEVKKAAVDLYAHGDWKGRLPDSYGSTSLMAEVETELSKRTMSVAECAIQLNKPRLKIFKIVKALIESGRVRRLGEAKYRTKPR